MSQNQNKIELYLMHLLENDLDDQQRNALLAWSKEGPHAVEMYCAFIRDYSIIKGQFVNDIHLAGGSSLDTRFDKALWDALIEDEKTAPEIEVPKKQPQHELIQKVERQKVDFKISKSSIFSLVAAAAAIIFILVFAHFAPTATGYKVAIVSDCVDTRWAGADIALEKDSPLYTSREYLELREGYVKLLFDNQTQVLVEGPAKFRILSEDKLDLHYGKLYSIVSSEAIGFMVTTQNAKIIDLGTEFGVDVDMQGDTSLHVMKGKTSLVTGTRSDAQGMEVLAGVAKMVSAVSGSVSGISCDGSRFVRNIDSSRQLFWRAQAQTQDQAQAQIFNEDVKWNTQSGNWSDNTKWNTGVKPDGTRNVELRKGRSSVCTINTHENLLNSRFTAANGQTINIENNGYLGCGWSRFGWSAVNMTDNGTWVLNDETLVIGYPSGKPGACVWTMSDTSKIIMDDQSSKNNSLVISQDNASGTLRLVGSDVTVHCNWLYLGYVREDPDSWPSAVLEYVMDSHGVSTIHVDKQVFLSQGAAMSHLALKAPESLPVKDLVLIATKANAAIAGDGVFDTLNGGPATEGTAISLGGNHYVLTYQYDADGDGCRNDIALVLKK